MSARCLFFDIPQPGEGRGGMRDGTVVVSGAADGSLVELSC